MKNNTGSVGMVLSVCLSLVSAAGIATAQEWSEPVGVKSSGGGAAWHRVSISANGSTAIAIWVEYAESSFYLKARVWSLKLGTWSWSATDIDAGPDIPLDSPEISMSETGDACVVWARKPIALAPISNIYARRFSRSSGWGDLELLDITTNDVYSPRVSMNPSGGTTMVVWTQNRSSGGTDVMSRRHVGGVWGPVEMVNSPSSNNFTSPRCAVDPDGNAQVVYVMKYAKLGAAKALYVRRRPSSTTVPFDSAIALDLSLSGYIWEPQIGVDSSGSAVAAWIGGASRSIVYVNRYTSGSWGVGININDGLGGSLSRVRLAVASNGNAVAVWHASRTDGFRIHANRLVDGAWLGAAVIDPAVEDATDPTDPEVAVDSLGNATAVFTVYTAYSDGSGAMTVYANRGTVDSGWMGATSISATGLILLPQVASDSSGRVWATWLQHREGASGIHLDIRGSRYQ